MNSPLLRFVSISLAALVLTAPTRAQLKFAADHPIALRAGEGATAFTLTNSGTTAVPLALTPAPITDATTHAALLKAKATLGPIAGAAALPSTIAAGETLTLQATITGVAGASAAELPIFNGNTQLGRVSLVEIDAPLNLTIEGDGAPDQPLAYTYRTPVDIALKNGDPQPYSVHWDFQLSGKPQASGDFDIAANGGTRISVEPRNDVYSLIDRIHPSAKQGVLLLSVTGPRNIADGLLPARTLPVNLLMRRVADNTSTTFSYAYAGLLLFLGGILSILASSVLPNMQNKVNLRAQLKDLANRTTSISTRVDSYLRVLLRLERKRIEIAIGDTSVWLPAASDPLDLISLGLATLSKRLTAVERLDDLCRKHDLAAATAPPSVTDDIDTKLNAAADQLHSLTLSDAALAAATASLDKAQASIAMLDDADALAKLISANFVALKTRLAIFPLDYSDLKAALPGIFVIVEPNSGYDDPKNIVRPMLFGIDHGVAAIHLALDYTVVRTSIPIASATQDCKTPGQSIRDRIAAHHCHLIDLLGTLSWHALREATLLVQQMREDIYEEDIFAEIAKSGQAEPTFDTQRPRPFLPVFFTITFKDTRFNSSAALQRMGCQWSFPDALCEQGWKVCHYFSGDEHTPATPCSTAAASTPQAAPLPVATPAKIPVPASHSLRARFKALFGVRTAPRLDEIVIHASVRGHKSQPGETPTESPLVKTIQIQRNVPAERSRFFAEGLRFAIAFGVALAGLLSGALAQLSKLDFFPATVAIIALGFGADSIKNLLTQPPKKS